MQLSAWSGVTFHRLMRTACPPFSRPAAADAVDRPHSCAETGAPTATTAQYRRARYGGREGAFCVAFLPGVERWRKVAAVEAGRVPLRLSAWSTGARPPDAQHLFDR